MLKKKYVCDHPSCGRLFRLQKQLLRHAKHHTGDVRTQMFIYKVFTLAPYINVYIHLMTKIIDHF